VLELLQPRLELLDLLGQVNAGHKWQAS
jgi:hypothetical protein